MMRIKSLLFVFAMMVSAQVAAFSTVTDIKGHVAPVWRGAKDIKATIGIFNSGSYRFGDPIRNTNGQLIETEYIPHFHLSYSSPRFRCTRGETYRATVTTEGIGTILGEKDGYAVIQSNIPGVGYRLDIGGEISGTYVNPSITRYSKIGVNGATDIDLPCTSQNQFALGVKVTLVRTDEQPDDSQGLSFLPVHIASPYPVAISVYDPAGNLVLDGRWSIPLKKTSNIAVKYLKESCQYRFSNREQIISLGKVASGQFSGPGSTAYGENGPQSVDVYIDCGGTNFIQGIRASVFEGTAGNEASAALRRQGVLLNNLTGQNAAKGVGVQVLIDNNVKPLGTDMPVYIDDDTQWDVVKGGEIIRGIYHFAVSGRYYQTEPQIREGLIQTTAGFTLIYR